MSVSVAVLATFDTKLAEAQFVGERIAALGGEPRWVDLSLVRASAQTEEGEAPAPHGELGPEAKRAAMQDVVERVSAELLALLRGGDLEGIIGLGGGQGTWIIGEIAKRLPLGVPKVLVTTLATRAGTYLEGTDVIVVPSITDIAGLNPLLRGVLDRAAAAVVAAARQGRDSDRNASAVTAMTMFGVTTRGGTAVKKALEAGGIEVAVFHANGNGGSLMEGFVEDGAISGVLDWTTTELTDALLGGIATAGSERLTAAGRAGIPQLVVPGALDVVNFGRPDTVPARYKSRTLYSHTPAATLMRADAEDMRMLAQEIARKLNSARGPVAVVAPERGFSALGAPGRPFHDAEADAAWIETMRAELDPAIPLTTHPYNINDPEFAVIAAAAYLDLVRATEPNTNLSSKETAR